MQYLTRCTRFRLSTEYEVIRIVLVFQPNVTSFKALLIAFCPVDYDRKFISICFFKLFNDRFSCDMMKKGAMRLKIECMACAARYIITFMFSIVVIFLNFNRSVEEASPNFDIFSKRELFSSLFEIKFLFLATFGLSDADIVANLKLIVF